MAALEQRIENRSDETCFCRGWGRIFQSIDSDCNLAIFSVVSISSCDPERIAIVIFTLLSDSFRVDQIMRSKHRFIIPFDLVSKALSKSIK